jgi:hypothetical protein
MDSNLLNLQLWDPRGNGALSGIGTMQGEISEYKAGVQLYTDSCFTHFAEFVYQDIDNGTKSNSRGFFLGTRVNF